MNTAARGGLRRAKLVLVSVVLAVATLWMLPAPGVRLLLRKGRRRRVRTAGGRHLHRHGDQ